MDETNQDNQVINGSDANTQTDASVNTDSGYTEREKQYYARMKKEESRVAALEKELNSYKSQTPASDLEWRERMEIKLSNGIKDDSQLDFIMKNGGKKALEDPFVQAALKQKQEEAQSAEMMAFNTSPKASIDKRFSQADIQAMSADELAAAIQGRKIK